MASEEELLRRKFVVWAGPTNVVGDVLLQVRWEECAGVSHMGVDSVRAQVGSVPQGELLWGSGLEKVKGLKH